MAFDVLSFLIGQHTAKGSGGETGGDTGNENERITVLEKSTYNFEYYDVFGAFTSSTDSLLFDLEKDKEYIVEWDDVEYNRTAFEFTAADGASCIALGNPICAGGESNGDSFAIVTDETNSYTHFLSLEQAETHSVAIYKEKEEANGVDPYYQKLAEALMTRDSSYLSEYASEAGYSSDTLYLKNFVMSDGDIFGSLASYSFAGFSSKQMVFSSIATISDYAFRGCEDLEIIDITIPNGIFNLIICYDYSFAGCENLKAVIFRDGGQGFISADVFKEQEGNDNFYIYVPRAYYDTIIGKLNAEKSLPASRYRILEDYPDIDNWKDA